MGTLLNTKCTERVKHRHFVSVMELLPWLVMRMVTMVVMVMMMVTVMQLPPLLVMLMVTMDNGGDDYVDGDGDAIAPLAGDVEGMQGPTR